MDRLESGIDEMNRVCRLMGYTCEAMAEFSGIPLSTVQEVLGKQTSHPERETLEALQLALQRMISKDQEEGNVFHEAAAPYSCGGDSSGGTAAVQPVS